MRGTYYNWVEVFEDNAGIYYLLATSRNIFHNYLHIYEQYDRESALEDMKWIEKHPFDEMPDGNDYKEYETSIDALGIDDVYNSFDGMDVIDEMDVESIFRINDECFREEEWDDEVMGEFFWASAQMIFNNVFRRNGKLSEKIDENKLSRFVGSHPLDSKDRLEEGDSMDDIAMDIIEEEYADAFNDFLDEDATDAYMEYRVEQESACDHDWMLEFYNRR